MRQGIGTQSRSIGLSVRFFWLLRIACLPVRMLLSCLFSNLLTECCALRNFLQQPRSNLTEALEQCSSYPVAMLRSCWRKFTEAVGKNGSCRGKNQYVARENTDIRQPCLIRVKKAKCRHFFVVRKRLRCLHFRTFAAAIRAYTHDFNYRLLKVSHSKQRAA